MPRLTNRERLNVAKLSFQFTEKFLGVLALHLKVRETDGRTFMTDGEYLHAPVLEGNKFPWDMFSDAGIKFVLAHEVMHCALGHPFRRGQRKVKKWNLACDYAVNSLLVELGKYKVEFGAYNPQFSGKTAEEIYSLLKDEDLKEFGDKDEDLLEVEIQDDENGEGENEQEQKGGDKEGKEKGSGDKDKRGKEGEKLLERERKNKSLEMAWKNRLTQAVKMALGRGNIPSQFKEMIDEYLNPKLPWQQLLYNQMKEFKGSSDYQWYPFSRGHIYREIYLPSLMGDGIELNVCIDTSGSISIKQAQYFLSEILGITNTFGNYIIHYFEADCALTVNNLIITPDENKVPMEIKGRGGTSFVPYFKEIEKLELDHLPTLYFTDMDGTMPTKSYPNVFWLVVEGQNVTKEPKFGKILEIPVEKAGANPNWRKPVQLPNVGVIKRKVRR